MSCECVHLVSHRGGSAGLAVFNVFISNVKEHPGRIVKHPITRAGEGREVMERGTRRMESLTKKTRAGWQRVSKCTWRGNQSNSAPLQKEGVGKAGPCMGWRALSPPNSHEVAGPLVVGW